MNALNRVRPAWWGLLVCAFVALFLGLAFQEAREGRERVNRSAIRLREVRQAAERVESQRSSLARAAERPAVSIGELLEVYLPEAALRVEEERSEPVGEEHRLRSARVAVEGAAWDEVRALLERAGTQRPAWVLRGAELRAGLEGLEGTLRLDALDKAPGSP